MQWCFLLRVGLVNIPKRPAHEEQASFTVQFSVLKVKQKDNQPHGDSQGQNRINYIYLAEEQVLL